MRKNWYTILLAGSFVVMAAGKGVPTAAALLTQETAVGLGREESAAQEADADREPGVRAGTGADAQAEAGAGTGVGAGMGVSAGMGASAEKEVNAGAGVKAEGSLRKSDSEPAKQSGENAEAGGGDAVESRGASDGGGALDGGEPAEDREPAGGGDAAKAGNPAGSDAWSAAYRASVEENFSQTLFIGDSRTEGLSEYGDLGEAEIFASSGMSVFTLFDKSVSLKGGGEKKLEELLSERKFRTIFLMLGINELGYEYPLLLEQYRSAVEQIRQLQPSAVLILEANFHVTGDQASQSAVFRNDRIDALNQDIRKLALETGSGYIDINPLFDDEEGNLAAEYSADGIHILARYYKRWSDWLRAGGADS